MVSAAEDNSTNLTESDNVVESQVSVSNENVMSSGESDNLEFEMPVSDSNHTTVPGKITKRYVNGVEYSATFFDGEGNPLENTIVYCGVNSILYGVNATTGSDGKALFLLPLAKGNYTLYLVNPETGDLISDDINVFDVLTGGKNINVYFNSGKYYSVRVFGDDGNPVGANKKVTFTVNLKKYTVKTDKNGYAKLKLAFQPGTYLVTAQYGSFLVANKVIIKPTLIPLTQFGAKKLSKTFKYKVKLLNNKGKILKNKKIKVKFNKKTYIAKTNKKGIATFTLKTPTKAGKFNVVSTYGKAKATAQLIRYRIY